MQIDSELAYRLTGSTPKAWRASVPIRSVSGSPRADHRFRRNVEPCELLQREEVRPGGVAVDHLRLEAIELFHNR